MTRVLLDTSAYSAFKRGHREIVQILGQTEEIYLSPVTLGELRAGFLKGKWKRQNESELQDFLASTRVRIVDIVEETSESYALIQNRLRSAGTPIPTNDLWIAASAMQHGLRLVTTDGHFRSVVQVVVDYFEPL